MAEAFDVAGRRSAYEPGDILVIATSGDRTVEKSGIPYSRPLVSPRQPTVPVGKTERNLL